MVRRPFLSLLPTPFSYSPFIPVIPHPAIILHVKLSHSRCVPFTFTFNVLAFVVPSAVAVVGAGVLVVLILSIPGSYLSLRLILHIAS